MRCFRTSADRPVYAGAAVRTCAVLALLTACLTAGCTVWRPVETPQQTRLPQPKLAPNSVVLETVLVTFPEERDEEIERIWEEVEEPLPLEVRRKLEENGFWCGRCGMQLPAALRARLDEADSNLPDEEGQLPAQGQRIQCRTGKRKPLASTAQRPELHVLVRDAQGMLTGRTYHQARCQAAIRCYPQGDGSVQVQWTPEIEHGEIKPRHQSDGGLWQVRVGQEREVFQNLAAEATLTPGQTLILSCTPDRKGLGASFFSGERGRSLLLLRLAQTQSDALFARDEMTAPIATSGGN